MFMYNALYVTYLNEADPMSMTVLNRTHVMLFLSGPLAAADMVLVFLNLCSNVDSNE